MHTGYWSDERAIECLQAALGRCQSVPSCGGDAAHDPFGGTSFPAVLPFMKVLLWIASTFVVLLIVRSLILALPDTAPIRGFGAHLLAGLVVAPLVISGVSAAGSLLVAARQGGDNGTPQGDPWVAPEPGVASYVEGGRHDGAQVIRHKEDESGPLGESVG